MDGTSENTAVPGALPGKLDTKQPATPSGLQARFLKQAIIVVHGMGEQRPWTPSRNSSRRSGKTTRL